MTDQKLLELVANRVGVLTKIMAEVKAELAEVKATMATKDELAEIKADVQFIKNTVIKIENDHGQKLGALLNGYKLNSERLDRVEAKLAQHEAIILKRS